MNVLMLMFLFSVNIFANDVRFQNADCHFTNSEIKNAFQKFLEPFFKTTGHALKEETLKVLIGALDNQHNLAI